MENILKKKAFQDYKNEKLKKSKNWDFSTILVKNWQFFHLFITAKIGHKNVFENILERKKAFPDYKKQEVKVGIRRDLTSFNKNSPATFLLTKRKMKLRGMFIFFAIKP